jgi:hypothetical protein
VEPYGQVGECFVIVLETNCADSVDLQWFGDLGDGKHTGDYNDPRVAVIQVVPSEVSSTLLSF